MTGFTRLDDVRSLRPLVHCISNTVSANDCANLALAVGASPIMACAGEEVADIAAASAAAVLNTGTPDAARFDACLLCGRAAGRLGRPVVLDPVGVGASSWRLGRIRELLDAFTPTILRVNLGEAQALIHSRSGTEQGVDSSVPASREARRDAVLALAEQRRSVVLLSGPEDLVSDGEAVWAAGGGSSQMARITGAGCMLSVLCGVFAAVEPDALKAALLAALFWKACARQAERLAGAKGPGSFRTALLDAAGTLTAEELARTAQFEKLQ